jgi:hypothetical protein
MLSVIYAECHIQALYAGCHYAECRYAECRYTVCSGAVFRAMLRSFTLLALPARVSL